MCKDLAGGPRVRARVPDRRGHPHQPRGVARLHGARRDGHGWVIGVEDPDSVTHVSVAAREARLAFELSRGGIATSGDAHRFVLHDGKRYATSSIRARAGQSLARRVRSPS
jgi:thiamine biosynthesis lipoprotein ApbE